MICRPCLAYNGGRTTLEVGLSLGSNMGDRAEALRSARNAISGIPGIRIVAASPLYETEPVDAALEYREQMFLNAVLIVQSDVGITRLLDELRLIEDGIGRARGGSVNDCTPSICALRRTSFHQPCGIAAPWRVLRMVGEGEMVQGNRGLLQLLDRTRMPG